MKAQRRIAVLAVRHVAVLDAVTVATVVLPEVTVVASLVVTVVGLFALVVDTPSSDVLDGMLGGVLGGELAGGSSSGTGAGAACAVGKPLDSNPLQLVPSQLLCNTSPPGAATAKTSKRFD